MKALFLILMGVVPALAAAQMREDPRTFSSIVFSFVDIINMLLPLLVGLALLVFFKGLAQFIWNAGDAKSHEEGKKLIIWGLIALFIMVSVWGILSFAYRDFGFGNDLGIPMLPEGRNK